MVNNQLVVQLIKLDFFKIQIPIWSIINCFNETEKYRDDIFKFQYGQ